MSKTMEEILQMRTMYKNGSTYANICRVLKCSYKTARKYIEKEDLSPKPPLPKSEQHKRTKASSMDEWVPKIDAMLNEEKNIGTSKQKYTANKVYKLLAEQGCQESERTVGRWLAARRKELEIFKKKDEGKIPLEHKAGESQGDFGTLENFVENSKVIPGSHFVLDFPFSNQYYAQICYGQNTECLLESMKAIFEWIGGVPPEIWLDNASTMVSSMGKSVDDREMTDRFKAFVAHYGFEPHFANGSSGWEKGAVEVNVGTSRRDLLVPVPSFIDIDVFNKALLNKCEERLKEDHYKNHIPIGVLFEEDKKKLLPLPSVPFDTALYETARTNPCGMFTLENGNHHYSSSPAHASSLVRLKITARFVEVMDEENRVIVTHRRLYGKEGEYKESMDWLPYLDYIARKPRTWMNSDFRNRVPKELEDYIERIRNSDRGKVIKIIAKITKSKGFDEAVRMVMESVALDRYDPAGLADVYRRVFDSDLDEEVLSTNSTDDEKADDAANSQPNVTLNSSSNNSATADKEADEVNLHQYDALLM